MVWPRASRDVLPGWMRWTGATLVQRASSPVLTSEALTTSCLALKDGLDPPAVLTVKRAE
jgi:hypothetical protein